jgi:hypothetical protein
VTREYAGDQAAPSRRESNRDHTAVGFLAFAADETAFFEVVDYDREIAAAAQKFARQITLVQRAKVKQSLKDGELAVRQAAHLYARVETGRNRVRGPQEIDEGAQGALGFRSSFEMSRHFLRQSFEFK